MATKRTGKGTLSRAERREAILDAIDALFADRVDDPDDPSTSVSVDTLADAAGVSRPTFYQHFESADHAIAELHVRMLDQELDAVADIVIKRAEAKNYDTPAELLCHGIDLFIEHYRKNPASRYLWNENRLPVSSARLERTRNLENVSLLIDLFTELGFLRQELTESERARVGMEIDTAWQLADARMRDAFEPDSGYGGLDEMIAQLKRSVRAMFESESSAFQALAPN